MKIRLDYLNRYFLLLCAAIFVIFKIIRAFSGSLNNGGVWNYIQVLFTMLGLLCCLKYYRQYREAQLPFRWLVPYSLLALFFSAFTLDFSVAYFFSYLKIAYFLGTICLFYWVFSYDDINEQLFVKIAYYVTIIVVTIAMLYYYSNMSQKGMIADVYFALTLFPLVLVKTSSTKRIIPLLSLFIPLIMTGKRTGILCFVVMVLVYYLYSAVINNTITSFVKNLLLFLCVLGILAFVLNLLQYEFHIDILKQILKLSTDGGSGRDVRWESVIQIFKNESIVNTLFGNGKGSIFLLIGGHAHNDFLEILIENGVICFLFYIVFWITWTMRIVQMVHHRSQYAVYYMLCFISSLFVAMFSFFAIDATYVTGSAICIAFFENKYQNERNNGDGF